MAKGQGLNDVFAQLSAQGLHVASMRTKIESTRGAVHSARGQAGAAFRMNELAHRARGRRQAEPMAHQPRRLLDDRAQGIAARRPHLDSDDRAARHHDDAVLHHFRQPRRQPHRPMDGVPYMTFIAPGLIMMAVITNSFANVVSSFFSSKLMLHLEEMLVAPLGTYDDRARVRRRRHRARAARRGARRRSGVVLHGSRRCPSSSSRSRRSC